MLPKQGIGGDMSTSSQAPSIAQALIRLRDDLTGVELGLEVPSAADARRLRQEIVAQINDYLLPRLQDMDAPLLMVVGGSTGAGKSTLVNSLVGANVSRQGFCGPPRALPCSCATERRSAGSRMTGSCRASPRSTGEHVASARTLQLVSVESVPAGLALLDAPDIDSVVEKASPRGDLCAASRNTQPAGKVSGQPWSGLVLADFPGNPRRTPAHAAHLAKCGFTLEKRKPPQLRSQGG
jgi:hypothetical protein